MKHALVLKNIFFRFFYNDFNFEFFENQYVRSTNASILMEKKLLKIYFLSRGIEKLCIGTKQLTYFSSLNFIFLIFSQRNSG